MFPGDEGRAGLGDGGAWDGVEEEEVPVGGPVVVRSVMGGGVVAEGEEDGKAGDGRVRVLNVEDVVDEEGVVVGVKLLAAGAALAP